MAKHFEVNTSIGIWYNYSIPALEITDTNNVQVCVLECWSGGAGLCRQGRLIDRLLLAAADLPQLDDPQVAWWQQPWPGLPRVLPVHEDCTRLRCLVGQPVPQQVSRGS